MIRQGQRALAVGNTGEGKSEALLHLFAKFEGQRLLVDVQDHYQLGPDALAGGAIEVDDPRDLDWRARTIRYVPRRPGDPGEASRLYHAIFERGDLLVLLDEAEDVAPVGRAPSSVRRVLKQGRKHGITHLAATQRPFGVDPSVINQAEHAYVFRMVDVRDVGAIAHRLALPAGELTRELGQLPDHGYLYHQLGPGQPVARMPPLPAELIAATRRHVVNPN